MLAVCGSKMGLLTRSFPKRPLIRPSAVTTINISSTVRHATFHIPPPPNPRAQYRRFETRGSGSSRFGRRFRITAGVMGAFGVLFYVTNLETVPVTGRRRFNIVNAELETLINKGVREKLLQQFGPAILPQMHPYTRRVKKVMRRLVPVSGLEDLKWEVFVIADDTINNAFVIPGGKVFVFSGMLKIADTEDRLAAVLSHEISHAIARHVAERLSKMVLAIIPLGIASLAIGGLDIGVSRVLLDLLFLRPGSRKQEAEADYIGLMLMAAACYDPQQAMVFWERMEMAEVVAMGGGSIPQFLSAHPAHKTRIRNMRKWMPEALSKQAESDCAQTMDYADEFKKAFDLQIW